MKKGLIVFVTLIFLSSLASADFYTGNSLLSDLEKDFNEYMVDVVAAFGYVTGVFDACNGILYESPSRVTKGQIQDIAIKYLKNHPEERHESAAGLLIKAFKKAFPIYDE